LFFVLTFIKTYLRTCVNTNVCLFVCQVVFYHICIFLLEILGIRNEKSVTKIASSQKDFIFLSPERAATYQPRATPWVMVGLFLALKGRYIKSQIKHVTPFQG